MSKGGGLLLALLRDGDLGDAAAADRVVRSALDWLDVWLGDRNAFEVLQHVADLGDFRRRDVVPHGATVRWYEHVPEGSMMRTSSTLLFVHGFWHGAWCWSEVVHHAVAAGRRSVAVDVAGHGLYARRPRWLAARPYDPEAVDTEVSPVADVTLDEAAELLTAQVRLVGGGEPVTVVAHSAAGPVLTRVAERLPALVAHAVYLSAYMPASGVPAAAYTRLPEAADDQVAPLLRGDPARIGALRLDLATGDGAYRRALYEAFYGDVDPTLADAATGLLTPDGPIGIMLGTTTLTRDGWGSVPRTYLVCTKDMAIRPAVQARFVAEADAAFPDNPTAVVTLDASHSPFLSMPKDVADAVASLG